ncbi:MAG: DUF86 domain-containing protein [Clostridiales bacterium]|nr:DUF86 domain-containing protein [Clostridiales bacterium]MCF8021740.1 DUF86 domain-containing protein [Clostridiales bacterium]
MKNLNIDKLSQKALDIMHASKLLEKYAEEPKSEFLQDETIISAAKYQLIVAIEASQNICNHLAARLANRVPSSYSDCYLVLRDEGIIDETLALKLANMAKFRNLLVHKYGDIDDSKIYEIIRGGGLKDLVEFLNKVKKFTGGEL